MASANDIKGLPLSVYRDAYLGDCTGGGVSARCDRVTVIGVVDTTDERSGATVGTVADWRVAPVRDDAPPVVVVIARAGFSRDSGNTAFLEPVELTDDGRVCRLPGAAHGGNLAGGGGSSFRQVLAALLGYGPDALRVHDRYER